MTREHTWLEGLAALMATEWANHDRLFLDSGEGVSRREGIRWGVDMGLKWEQIPNLAALAEEDEEHGEMFLPVLTDFGNGNEERRSIHNARVTASVAARFTLMRERPRIGS